MKLSHFYTAIFLLSFTPTAQADMLLYAYNEGSQHRIHLMNTKTGNDTIISPENGAAWNAAFSPDGTEVIYTLQTDTGSQVYVADIDGTNPRQLTFDTQYAFHPSFSPDGTSIVYSQSDKRNLIMMNNDGSGAHVIAQSEFYDAYPVFFRDGKRILFHSRRVESENDEPGIFILDLETDTIVHTGLFGTYAYPSPDGNQIVFSGKKETDDDREIMLADIANPESVITLTSGGGYDGHPSFSPGGQKIIFVSRMAQDTSFPRAEENDTAGTNEVFSMNLDGSEIKQLTYGKAVAWHPVIR